VKKYLFAVFITVLCSSKYLTIKAQPQVKIYTCGVGQELYSCFGHSAVHIIDTNHGIDAVYNYGMFSFSDPQFYLKFVKGTLPYYIGKQSYEGFMYEYQADGRGVVAQLLNLDSIQAMQLYTALENNLLPQNKSYHYDFTFNNCSTKIRDLLDSLFGTQIVFDTSLPPHKPTYMHILNQYLAAQHWPRVGIDLLLSSKVNAYMNNYQAMFLPQGLLQGCNNATINGKPLVKQQFNVLPQVIAFENNSNPPAKIIGITTLILLLIAIFKNKYKALYILHRIASNIWMVISGLLGCLMLFMWLGTNHLQTQHNLNMLWLLPTHLLWPFINNKSYIKTYALASIIFCILFLIIIATKLQGTAIEALPLIIYSLYLLFEKLQHPKPQ
jgi:hypothetical protein